MSSKENTEFMRLIKASFNTSSYAVRNFITSNVIPNGKTFTNFLDVNLHDLYHKYQNQLPCCLPGCQNQSLPRKQQLFGLIFFQLYEFTKAPVRCKTGIGRKSVMVNGKMKIIQHCSCNVRVLAHVTLQNLDISVLNKILQETGNSNHHVTALCDVRNKICHAPKIKSFSHKTYMELWTKLETEVLKLADCLDPSVKDMITELLELIKACEIDRKMAEVLMKKVEEVKIISSTNAEAIQNLQDETIERIAHVDSELLEREENRFDQAVIKMEEVIVRDGTATRVQIDKLLKVVIEAGHDDKKKHMVHVGTSTDNDKEEESECSSCDQKDMLIRKLEKINTKHKEHDWKINKFMVQPDLEDISDDHSDNSSGYATSVEIEVDEELSDNSDYFTCPSSVRSESTPIQCYVEHSFESSLERLRLMMKEQNLDGREKLRIQIIFKEERDMKWTSDILNLFKEENNERFSAIEFFHVSSINNG